MSESSISAWQGPRVWRIDDVLARFVSAAFWNAASVGLGRLFNSLALLVASRRLGPDGYGALGVTQQTVAMLGVFAGFGLGLTATHLVARYRRTDAERAGEVIGGLMGMALLGGSLAAFVALAGGPLIAGRLLSSAELGPALQAASGLLILNAVQGVQQGCFAGLESVRALSVVQAAGGLLLVGGMYVGASWGGVCGCVIAQLLCLTMQVLLGHFVLRRIAAKKLIRIAPPHCRWSNLEFSSFGLPAALSAMMVVPVDWIAAVMLVNRPGGYVQMGLYAASWQWISPLLLAPMVVGQSILPIYGERYAAGDRAAPLRLLAAAMLMNAAIVLPATLAGAAFSSTLLSISGPEFVAGEAALKLLFVAAALYALEVPAGLFLAAQGWIWPAFAANLAWAVCLLAGVSHFVPQGAQGVALARLLSYLAHGVWLAVLVWRLQRSLNRHVQPAR
jgi:O-antigen/teichoic acid export membrane protein